MFLEIFVCILGLYSMKKEGTLSNWGTAKAKVEMTIVSGRVDSLGYEVSCRH